MRRCLVSCVSKERMNRSEAQVSAANTDTLTFFLIIQKRHDQWRVDFLEVQPRWRFLQPMLNELQKLTIGVAIRADRVRTGLTLLHQALCKEPFQQRGKG